MAICSSSGGSSSSNRSRNTYRTDSGVGGYSGGGSSDTTAREVSTSQTNNDIARQVVENPEATVGMAVGGPVGGIIAAQNAGGYQDSTLQNAQYRQVENSTGSAPTMSDAESAGDEQRRRYGRAATLLTGSLGLTDRTPNARRTLTGS